MEVLFLVDQRSLTDSPCSIIQHPLEFKLKS